MCGGGGGIVTNDNCIWSDKSIQVFVILTHLSLASLLWDIGKQYSPRCDAAERGVPSGAILFAQRISWKNEIKNKNHS